MAAERGWKQQNNVRRLTIYSRVFRSATASPRACADPVTGPPPAPPHSHRGRRSHGPPRRPRAAPAPSRAAGPRRQTCVGNKAGMARTHLPIHLGWLRLEGGLPQARSSAGGMCWRANGPKPLRLQAAAFNLEADHICIATRRPCVSGSISCMFSTPDERDRKIVGDGITRYISHATRSIYLLSIYLSIHPSSLTRRRAVGRLPAARAAPWPLGRSGRPRRRYPSRHRRRRRHAVWGRGGEGGACRCFV